MSTAKFVKEITVVDPDTGGDVILEVYKHENGGMLAMDASYLDHRDPEDKGVVGILDPFTDLTKDIDEHEFLYLEG
jgi:hypothetical protein